MDRQDREKFPKNTGGAEMPLQKSPKSHFFIDLLLSSQGQSKNVSNISNPNKITELAVHCIRIGSSEPGLDSLINTSIRTIHQMSKL